MRLSLQKSSDYVVPANKVVLLYDPDCCITQIAELGHGTFGIVIKAWDMRTQPPTEVAIKMLPRGDFVGAQVLSSHRIWFQRVPTLHVALCMCAVIPTFQMLHYDYASDVRAAHKLVISAFACQSKVLCWCLC